MSEKWFGFRVDANESIGMGHANRCLNLANSLARFGHKCIFICYEPSESYRTQIQTRSYELLLLDEEISNSNGPLVQNQLQGLLGTHQVDTLIFDGYQFDREASTAFRAITDNLVAVDECPRPLDCDILIDMSLNEPAQRWDGHLPDQSYVLSGKDWALVSTDLFRLRQARSIRNNTTDSSPKLLISFGGSDQAPPIPPILGVLDALDAKLVVTIINGGGQQEPIINSGYHNLALQQIEPQENFPEILAEYDFAITACGMTALDRCALGKPGPFVCIAENQKPNAEALSRMGATVLMASSPDFSDQLKQTFKSLLESLESTEIPVPFSSLCDGLGAARTACALSHSQKKIRLAKQEDESLLLELQRLPQTRQHSFNNAVPTAQEHHRWFSKKLADPNCVFHLIEIKNQFAGFLRLDRIANTLGRPTFEISIAIHPDFNGKNLGSWALSVVPQLFPEGFEFIGRVKTENIASRKSFLRAGYAEIDDGFVIRSL